MSVYVDASLYGALHGAHRVAYEAAHGAVPPALVVDHRCRVRCCVNPAHMEAVTEQVNIARGNSPSAIHAKKTHCVNGHPFDEINTRIAIQRGRVRRACRTCNADSHRRLRRRSAGAA